MIDIRSISVDDELYVQECDLRERVLLRSVGYDMDRWRAEFGDHDAACEHFVAVFDHPRGPRVIGCALLRIGHPSSDVGQLTHLTIDPQRQGEGLGKQLVAIVERRALGELALAELFCHAPEETIGFYDKLGWGVTAETFTEAGIPHRRMVIRANVEGSATRT